MEFKTQYIEGELITIETKNDEKQLTKLQGNPQYGFAHEGHQKRRIPVQKARIQAQKKHTPDQMIHHL